MSSHDVNKLIEEAFGTDAASDVFKENLLQNSTTAFVRSRVLQSRIRMTGFTLIILLITAATFVFGRFSVSSRVTNRQVAGQAINEKDEGIMVSKDLVAWLDAARFFTRLGMEERAALSYKQASDLVPYDTLPENYQAGLEVQRLWAGISEKHNSTGYDLHKPLDQIRTTVNPKEQRRELKFSHQILSEITTYHFGRSEP